MGQLSALFSAGPDFPPIYIFKMFGLSSKLNTLINTSQLDPAKLCSVKTAARNAAARHHQASDTSSQTCRGSQPAAPFHRSWHTKATVPSLGFLSLGREAASPNTEVQQFVIKYMGQLAWNPVSEVLTTTSLNSVKAATKPCHTPRNPSQYGTRVQRTKATSNKPDVWERISHLCGWLAYRLEEG